MGFKESLGNPHDFFHPTECEDRYLNKSQSQHLWGVGGRERVIRGQRRCIQPVAWMPALTTVTVFEWKKSSLCLLGVETLMGESLFLVCTLVFIPLNISGDGLFINIALPGLIACLMGGLWYGCRLGCVTWAMLRRMRPHLCPGRRT